MAFGSVVLEGYSNGKNWPPLALSRSSNAVKARDDKKLSVTFRLICAESWRDICELSWDLGERARLGTDGNFCPLSRVWTIRTRRRWGIPEGAVGCYPRTCFDRDRPVEAHDS